MLKIPCAPHEIETEWLAHVLDLPVTAHRLVDAHAGTTGRAVLELDYQSAQSAAAAGNQQLTALPPRLFVKLPPTDEMQRAFVTSTGMGRREARFYRELAEQVPVRVPHCYFSDWDDSGEEYIMLLEHLEDCGCTFQNASKRYSAEYVRDVVTDFAKLHAAFWESPRFTTDLAWVEPPVQHDIALDLIASALEKYANSMPPVFTQMAELYLTQADAIHALWKEGPNTLIHGDVHDANLFLDKTDVGFLDWAIVSRAPGMRDVGYFLAGTLQAADYESLPALLAHYRATLAQLGVEPPSADELWLQCQWHAAYVWVGAAVTVAMGDAWQPLGYMLASLERLHGALEHLSSVDAIRGSL